MEIELPSSPRALLWCILLGFAGLRGRPAGAAPDAAAGIYYYRTYTHNNRVGLTVTNYGFLGNNLTDRQPSMEYPLGSGYEHLVRAGLWVGALAVPSGSDTTPLSLTHVTTGCVDGRYSDN